MNDLTEIHAGNSKYLYSRQYDCMTYISSNNKYKNCLDDDRDINVKKHNNRNNAKLANINIYKALLNPNQIVFEVTERCNLSCVYCAYGKMYTLGKSRNEYNMKWETAKVVLDHYINIWKKIFPHNLRQKCNIGFYGGEALLGIDLIKKIISYIENNAPKNINITYSMTTNGVLLLKHVKYLMRKSFILSVSLDGDRMNNEYRVFKDGTESFNIVFNNLKEIKKYYPAYFSNCVVILSVLHNKNSINQIINFLNSELSKKPIINELSLLGVKDESLMNQMFKSVNSKEISHINKSNTNDYFDAETTSIEALIRCLTGNYVDRYTALMDLNDTHAELPTATCIPFKNNIYITASGKILPCEKIGYEFPLGEVGRNRLKVNLRKIKVFYNKIYNNYANQCNSCFLINSCKHCFYFGINIESKNVICPDFFPKEKLIECTNSAFRIIKNNPKEYSNAIKRI